MGTKSNSSVMLLGVFVALIIVTGMGGYALAAEAQDLSGDKPFFEIRDEEMQLCAIDVAMDGTVLLFKERSKEEGFIGVKRSEDGGKTWGDEIEVGKRAKLDGDMSNGGLWKGEWVGWTTYGGNVVVDENTGDIMLIPTSLKAAQVLHRSRDHGKTWKTENTVIKPDVHGWVCSTMGCEHGITLRYGKKKGRLLMPTRVFWAYHNEKGQMHFDNHYSNAIYSDDGGKTWTPSAPFPLHGTGEAGLAELSDGRIYYCSRTHVRPGNKRIAWSYDGGERWTDEYEDDELFDGPPDVYGCKAGLVRLPYDDRDILVFSRADPSTSTAHLSKNPRRDITVWISLDGGETWPAKRLVREGFGNYTWMAAGRNGTPSEGLIYLASNGGKYVARFNVAWIMEHYDEVGEAVKP